MFCCMYIFVHPMDTVGKLVFVLHEWIRQRTCDAAALLGEKHYCDPSRS